MPEVKFGHKDESSVRFRKSEDLIAVRTRSRRSATAISVPSAVSAELSGGQLVVSFPEAFDTVSIELVGSYILSPL